MNFLSLPVSVLNRIFQVVSKRLPRVVYSGIYVSKICLSRTEQELCWWLSAEESTCQCRRRPPNGVREGSLYKEMATHSSLLAWKIPWTEEPSGLQSMGSQSDMTEQLNTHFPGGLVIKNLPDSEGDTDLIPGPGGSHLLGATRILRHNYWACAREPKSGNYWSARA